MIKRLLYSPFLAQVVVTRRCNLECGYCNEFDKHSDPVPLEELKKRLDKLKALGTFAVEFTGGEPLLNPHIFEIIRYANKLGFVKVMMISNAYLFTEDKVHKLNKAGLNELQISVDGVTTNETTIKVLNPLRKKLSMLAREADFKVVLSAVLGSAPPEEVMEVVRFAKHHGFRPRVLVLHDGKGQFKMSTSELQTYAQIKAAIGEHFQEAKDYRSVLALEGRAPFKCRSGSRYLYVSEFGVVHWCSQTRDEFGIPLEEYSWKELKRQFNIYKKCNEQCTIGCARTNSAYDQWRPQRDGRELKR